MLTELDRTSETPLFAQLYQALRHRITRGTLKSGDRLPSSRVLAAELGVARSTIVSAYDQLTAEGYIEGRRGSGLFVCTTGTLDPAFDAKPTSLVRHTAVVSTKQPTPRRAIPFSAGAPDMRLFPYSTWSKSVARTARLHPQALIEPGPAQGNPLVRAEIARHLGEWRGVACKPEQVFVTAGAVDALELCVRALLSTGETIGLENPTYLPLKNFALNQGLTPVYLPVEVDGAALPEGTSNQPSPRLVVLTPSHQFPLGGAMPAQRRRAFLDWAKTKDAYLVEDDYDSEFRYAGRPIPALSSLDNDGRCIYIGSFAKVFSVGLRLGVLVVPEALIETFIATIRRFGTKASMMPQLPLADFMARGDFLRHIRRMRRIYGERRRALLELIQEHLGDQVRVRDHSAGMHLVVELPPGLDDQHIAQSCRKHGLDVQALSTYFTKNGEDKSALLLGFCGFTQEEMAEAMPCLANIIHSARNQPGSAEFS